jgi:hypothetical protein
MPFSRYNLIRLAIKVIFIITLLLFFLFVLLLYIKEGLLIVSYITYLIIREIIVGPIRIGI